LINRSHKKRVLRIFHYYGDIDSPGCCAIKRCCRCPHFRSSP